MAKGGAWLSRSGATWSATLFGAGLVPLLLVGPGAGLLPLPGSTPGTALPGSPAASPPSPSSPPAPVVAPVSSNPVGPACPSTPYTQTKPGMDPNGPQGMDTEQACSSYTQGDPRVVVAYVEGGVNWQMASGIVDHIYVNWKELPIPCVGSSPSTAVMPTLGNMACVPAWSPDPSYYAIPTTDGSDVQDAPDGQPVVNASDWSRDPRVHDVNGNGYIDPEDLIAAFSCFDPESMSGWSSTARAPVIGTTSQAGTVFGTPSWPGGTLSCSNGAQKVSTDGSGFPHDISGWDFYDNDNDPATPDATYPHSDSEMANLASYCPYCMVMPVKAGAEALDETDELAEAWLFAGETGASVITSVTADLGYSSFMSDVVQHLWSTGVVMVEASNDFDSTDHQGGMFWPDVVPGNSVQPNAKDDGWIRSDTTSWGTHDMFDDVGDGTTSTGTADMGGLFGLLMSYGDEHLGGGLPTAAFTGPEAVQVVRETATPFHDTHLAWPGAPGDWSEQYGYGLVNLYKAMQAVHTELIPPVATITSPNWYSVWDPTSTRTMTVTGQVEAPAGSAYSWRLQYGLGPQPSSWTTIGTGQGTGTGTTSPRPASAVLHLRRIPKNVWGARFHISQNHTLPSADQYDVTLRLVVHNGAGLMGTDRRTVDVVHDATWAAGYPMPIGSSGESAPAVANLTGGRHSDIIFGTSNGTIDVVDAKTGKTPAGSDWGGAHTDPTTVQAGWPAGAPWPLSIPEDRVYDAILADVAVGDLDGSGSPSVVATTESGWVYVFDAKGDLEPGWPRPLRSGVSAVGVPRPADPYTRLAMQGATAAPVLVALDPSTPNRLDIVQAAWDGHIHALLPDQTPGAPTAEVAGWPVAVPAPSTSPPSGYDVVDDHKLDATPAVAYFAGHDQPPSIVVRSQYSFTKGSGLQEGGFGFVYAFNADGSLRSGWPVELPAVAEYYGSAQEFITEGTSSPQAADVTGDGDDEVAVSMAFSPPVLLNGSGHLLGAYAGTSPGVGQFADPTTVMDPTALEHGVDVPISFATSGGAFGLLGGLLHYAAPQTGGASLAAAEEENNFGLGIDEYESVFPAAGGPDSPGFPQTRMGLDFLSAPIFASVDQSGLDDVVDGGDSDAMTGYTDSATTAPGFPKWTTGWSVFGPTAGDLFGNGRNDIVMVTREGYLFVWKTDGRADTPGQWPRWQHDDQNTGNAGTPLGSSE